METNRRKIIYVDDVNYSLVSLKDRLKDRYEVYPAISAEKMFEILLHVEPDIILLDVNMPKVDGYETILRLKADARYAKIPVIFLTAASDKESVFKGLNHGAAAYVSKPFTTSVLVEQIERVLHPKVRFNPLADLLSEGEDCDKPIILAVDDVSVMLRTLNFALRDKYNVCALSKPNELKSLLRQVKPDLFLLDLNMPEISGFDLVPIIRSFPEHKETPIIFVTADGTADKMTEAARLGACDFIVKPIDTVVLREKIEKNINKYKKR